MKRIAAALAIVVVMGAPSAARPGTSQPAPVENTTWRLTAIRGHEPSAIAALRRAITIRFESGRVSGFSGCNAFGGPYTLHQNKVMFGDLAGTMMACGEPGIAHLEDAFRTAIAGHASFTIENDRLTLTTRSGAVLTFEKEARATLDGAPWSVTSYNNGRQAVVSPIPNTELTLIFEKGTASGHAGCNTFRGPYTVNEGSLTFGPVITTRRMCSEDWMTQEREFLAALALTSRWAIQGGILQLYRADGERVLTAVRPAD